MSKIQRIDEIGVKNIRGIGEPPPFKVEILPNKLTMLVAPNGSGKSSIATAFSSLKSKKLQLHKDACHKGNESLKPSLSISYTLDNRTKCCVEADETKNEIADAFDVYVITSRLSPKGKKLKISGNTIVSASLEVEPIVLVRTIPERARLLYDLAKARATFGGNGKAIPNISADLRRHEIVADLSVVDFSKHFAVKSIAAVSKFQNEVKSAKGNVQNILQVVDVKPLAALQYLVTTVEILKRNRVVLDSEASYFLAALSIAEIWAADRVAFQKAVKYSEYCIRKLRYEREFSFLRNTWKNISPRECDGQLVVEFPKAHLISNGERDIVSFLAHFLSVKAQFGKKPIILIIDEIFDYLDDANIVTCQYHISSMIDEMKRDGLLLFAVVMSHLDPAYFRNFYFSRNSLKVAYLNGARSAPSSLEKVIFKRDDPAIQDPLAKYLLHYHSSPVDLSKEFAALGLPSEFASTGSFLKNIQAEYEKYSQGKKYDPVAVCCVVRRAVEECAYALLNAGDQATFLDTKKTAEKLKFAAEKGADIPDVFFLLGIVYNSGLRITPNWDNATPIRSQLDHLTIREMITKVVGRPTPLTPVLPANK